MTTGRLKSKAGTGTRCVSYTGPNDGAKLRLYICSGNATHLTEFDRVDGYIKNRAPVFSFQANEDGTVTQQEYKGSPNQAWEIIETGDFGSYWKRLRIDYKSRCAVVRPDDDVRHTKCSNVDDDPASYWIYNPNDETWRTALDFDKCMDVEGANFRNNTQIIVWPCHGGSNQRWFRNSQSKVIFSRGNPGYCLNGHKADGNYEKVQIYEYRTGSNEHCTGNRDNEQWNMDIAHSEGKNLVAFGWFRDRATGKCLQLYGLGLTRMGDCVVNDLTQWMYDEVGATIRPKSSPNHCLDHMGYKIPGAALRVQPCGKGRETFQKFDRQGEGFILRNGIYLTGGTSTPEMRIFSNGNNQLFDQINVKKDIEYDPQMHDCGDFTGRDKVYTGQVDADGEPIYFDAVVRQCVRPKSYWHGYPNICAKNDSRAGCLRYGEPKQRWIPCDPFDTYKANGEYNPARDDLFTLYPHPFGPQTLVCGTATNVHDPGNSGWWGLKVDSIKLSPDTEGNEKRRNTIELALSAHDMRIEMGLWGDVNLKDGKVNIGNVLADPKRQWALLTARIKKLTVKPKIKLYSIDSTSCNTPDGSCEGFWNAWNNQLTDPDRLVIEVILDDSDIDLQLDSPAYDLIAAKDYCFVWVVNFCAYSYDEFLGVVMEELEPTIVETLKPAIDDAVKGAVNSIPNLNILLGDPMNLGRTLIDVGIYATPENDDFLAESSPESGRKWPVRIFGGPGGAGREVTDLRLAVGMKPVAFKPPASPNGFVTVDPNDPPARDSIYGVPTLVDPDTRSCFNLSGTSYAHDALARGSYTYNNKSGMVKLFIRGGNGADIQAGYTFQNASGAETKILRVGSTVYDYFVWLAPGLQDEFGTSGEFSIPLGVINNLSFNAPGSISQVKKNQVFRDESTQAGARVIIFAAHG